MLLLVAIALVLIGVVTLIVGIFSDTLFWVFVSIGSTVLAGIVLYVLYRVGRGTAVSEPAPAPIPPVSEPTAVVPTPAPLREVDEPVPAGVAGGSGFAPAAGDEDYEFPIAEYDELRVAEILPLLPELDADELVVVRDREQAGKARATILARITELADAAPAPTITFAPAAAPATTGPFPITNYDNLKVAEILPLVRRLNADELEEVAAYEEDGANRQTILNLIDNRLAALDGGAPPEPVKKAAPAKKAAAPAAKKAAAPAKKAAVPAAKKAAAPAKKAAAPATKKAAAPAKKAAAPAAKKAAAPAKKATAPAKKATKAAKATKKSGR